jgi:Cytochrome C assembly protein
MFDLEPSITEWRRQMLAAGLKTGRRLDELESHLREEISALKSAGASEPVAFEQAVARLGSPHSVYTEFNKIRVGHIWPVKIGWALWLAATLLLAGGLMRGLLAGRLNLLLGAHILSVTAGYGGAMLLGGFGILYVVWGRSGRLSPARRQSLNRAVHRFGPLAAGLVIAGLLLGMLWSRQNLGRYWDWDPKEIGGLCASAWLVALVVMQRYGRLRDRAVMLLGIGGSTVVNLAWFGGNLWDNHRQLRAYGSETGWLLAVLLGIHLVFLVMGMTPAREARES